MKKIFKIIQTYKNINERINFYTNLKQVLLAMLCALIPVTIVLVPSVFLIHYLWYHAHVFVYIVVPIVVLLIIYGYYIMYFATLRRLAPKVKAVNIKTVFWVDSIIASVILLTLVIIFLTQLKK